MHDSIMMQGMELEAIPNVPPQQPEPIRVAAWDNTIQLWRDLQAALQDGKEVESFDVVDTRKCECNRIMHKCTWPECPLIWNAGISIP